MNIHRRVTKESVDELNMIKTAQDIKQKLALIDAPEPLSFEYETKLTNTGQQPFGEVQRQFNQAKYEGKINYQKGFVFVPHERKSYDANKHEDALELHKKFGNGVDPIHVIARTDNPTEYVDNSLKKHYDDIIREKKIPVIGGASEGGKHYTDIATIEPISDEKAKENLKKYGQRLSGRVDRSGHFSLFAAKQEDPLQIIYQGKQYNDFSELPFGTMTAKSEGDWSTYDLVLTNVAKNRIYDLEVKTNMAKGIDYELDVPIMIEPNGKVPVKLRISRLSNISEPYFGFKYKEKKIG